MGTKKIRLPITIGVVDHANSTKDIKAENGMVLQPANTVVKHIPAGQPVELDAAEADRLLEKFGPYTKTVVVTGDDVPMTPAPLTAPARSVK